MGGITLLEPQAINTVFNDASGLYNTNRVEGALEEIGGVYVRAYWYQSIASGTSGTLSAPPYAQIVLDQWPNAADALSSNVGSDGTPNWTTPHTNGGSAIFATLDAMGNWTLSGTPSQYPVAIVFCYELPITRFDREKSISESIIGSPEGQWMDGYKSKTVTYNVDGTLHQISSVYGTKTMSYDENKKLIGIAGTGIYPTKSFSYDGNGSLTAVTVG